MKLKQLLNIEFSSREEAIAVIGSDRLSIIIPQEFPLHPTTTVETTTWNGRQLVTLLRPWG